MVKGAFLLMIMILNPYYCLQSSRNEFLIDSQNSTCLEEFKFNVNYGGRWVKIEDRPGNSEFYIDEDDKRLNCKFISEFNLNCKTDSGFKTKFISKEVYIDSSLYIIKSSKNKEIVIDCYSKNILFNLPFLLFLIFILL